MTCAPAPHRCKVNYALVYSIAYIWVFPIKNVGTGGSVNFSVAVAILTLIILLQSNVSDGPCTLTIRDPNKSDAWNKKRSEE